MNSMLRRTIRAKVLSTLLLTLLCHGLHLAAQTAEQQPSADQTTTAKSEEPRPERLSLSDQVIQDILEPLRAGMEGQNLQQVMSVFDKQTPNYSSLQDQLRAFFQMYSQVRFRYQILQATAEKAHGSATAEMEMDALPYEVTVTPERRSVQMRLQLKLMPKGWRIVSFTPADFFNATVPPGGLAR
ncbi:MAG: hypothetical protein WA655_07790 [Candidatus Korobacteraceae bacterium]